MEGKVNNFLSLFMRQDQDSLAITWKKQDVLGPSFTEEINSHDRTMTDH